jgi:hypothetical protein
MFDNLGGPMEVVLTGGSIPYTVNALDAVPVGHSLVPLYDSSTLLKLAASVNDTVGPVLKSFQWRAQQE